MSHETLPNISAVSCRRHSNTAIYELWTSKTSYMNIHRRARERFFCWGAKLGEKQNNQDNRIQSITLCNTYFSKKVYAVYNKAGEFLRLC